MFAVPTTPAAKLSAPTIRPNKVNLFHREPLIEKDKLVIRTSKAPIMSVNFTPLFLN